MIDERLAKRIFAKVRDHCESNPGRKGMERTVLPKEVSAGPIYKQLERLHGLKADRKSALVDLKAEGGVGADRVVGMDTFADFARRYREVVLRPENVNQAKQLIRKFVRRIDVSPTTVVIHFIVDADHCRTVDQTENNGILGLEKIEGPLAPRAKNSKYFSSNTLKVGAA